MIDTTHLSEAKVKLLQKYLSGSFPQSQTAKSSIPLRRSGEPIPLTMAQEELWRRVQETRGKPPIYNESITIHINGPLDPEVLKRSLEEVIGRHEAWRTTFDESDGGPVQIVHPPGEVPMETIDLSHLPHGEREATVLELVSAQLQRPFDLHAGPLFRTTLASLDDHRHRLYIEAHQIIIDGVTAYQVLYPELAATYTALIDGREPTLSELPVQYADYAYWQRQWCDEQVLQEQLAYWSKQLAGDLPVLNWPKDLIRAAPQTFRGAITSFAYGQEVSCGIKKVSQVYNATLFVTLMTAFKCLLYSYTGQEDMIVGTVVPAGRDAAEVQGLMGYFLNPIGLRSDLSGNPSFAELLRQVRTNMLEAVAHDDLPFERLVRHLGLTIDPSRNPVFQVAASLEPALPESHPGWNLTPMDLQNGGSRWDLYFVWDERPSGIIGRVQYSPDLFDENRVSKLIEDFEVILKAVVSDPDLRLSQLALLPRPQQH